MQFIGAVMKKRSPCGQGGLSGHVVAMGIQGLARDLGNNACSKRAEDQSTRKRVTTTSDRKKV